MTSNNATKLVTMTEREALAMREELPGLCFVDVTIHGDSERMVVITSPRCAYCGSWSTEAHCNKCGASVSIGGR